MEAQLRRGVTIWDVRKPPEVPLFSGSAYDVKAPVLLLYGERDRLMPVDASIATIESLLQSSGNNDVSAIILPNAPHTLDIQPGPKDAFFWWHVVAGYPDLVIDWIKRT